MKDAVNNISAKQQGTTSKTAAHTKVAVCKRRGGIKPVKPQSVFHVKAIVALGLRVKAASRKDAIDQVEALGDEPWKFTIQLQNDVAFDAGRMFWETLNVSGVKKICACVTAPYTPEVEPRASNEVPTRQAVTPPPANVYDRLAAPAPRRARRDSRGVTVPASRQFATTRPSEPVIWLSSSDNWAIAVFSDSTSATATWSYRV